MSVFLRVPRDKCARRAMGLYWNPGVMKRAGTNARAQVAVLLDCPRRTSTRSHDGEADWPPVLD